MRRRIAWLSAYAAAMAFLEATVVVYLRALYYPGGFRFPMAPMPPAMEATEIAREASTLVMLLAVAALASRGPLATFLHFAWAFAVWDVFYYVWLRALLGWPPSLLTPDLLFLVPVPWVGPVLAPLLVSGALLAGSLVVLAALRSGATVRFLAREWGAAAAGGLLIVLSFTLDFRAALAGRLPPPFRWGMFGAGLLLGLGALVAWRLRFRDIITPRGGTSPGEPRA